MYILTLTKKGIIMSKINMAKVNRLRRAAEVISTELTELVYLPEDIKTNLVETRKFLEERANRLAPEEAVEG